MPLIYKVLGQSNPASTTNTTLYTCPATASAVVSSLTIANLSTAAATTYRVAVRPAGATIANQHYVAFDAPLPAADTTILTLGVTLGGSDVVTVYAGNTAVAFSLFGTEVS